jgi:Inhibitor of Apoptosis domain
MSYVPKFRDRLSRLNTFVRYRGDNALVKELVDCGFFLESGERVCCFHCGCGFDISASAGLNMYTAHYKASARCAFLLSLLSEREQNKTRARAKHSAPLTYYVRERAPSHPEYADCYARLETLARIDNCARIARAGFFLNEKRFYCFECGCSASTFEQNPWKEHCVLNPNCRHLIQTRGFYYIQRNL